VIPKYFFPDRGDTRYSTGILPVDSAVALRCARLRVLDPRSERDALIAATALVHGMTVVTRNVGDFVATGVTLLNPWDALRESL
jgi:toxin FitB